MLAQQPVKPRRQIQRELRRAYRLMRDRAGHQGWWPGETPFEVCVGAILTQNTAWTNVEKAIVNLKKARVLNLREMVSLPESELAELIRPAGYFNLKARRLRSFLKAIIKGGAGHLETLFAGSMETARRRLLQINGIGPETADSMLLYASEHHSFVVDAYTRRIFSRHHWSPDDASYDELKNTCAGALNHKPARERQDYWNDYHAQLVLIGKDYCRPRNPRCEQCPLRSLLPTD
jgi:endonuclease-3 related protein